MQSPKDRIIVLDVLKALAILGVIGVHFNNAIPAPDDMTSKLAGYIGAACPQLFFIISAFILFSTIKKYDFSTRSGTVKFYISKAARILPLYFVMIAIYSVVNSVPPHLPSLLTHYLLVNALSPLWINDIISVEWYISDLLLLFLITPLLVRYIRDLRSAIKAMLIAMAVGAAVQIAYFRIFADTVEEYDIYTYFKTFCFLIQLPGMLLGVVIYYLTESNSPGSWIKTMWYVIFATCVTVIYEISSRFGMTLVSYIYVTYSIWGMLLLTGVLLEKHYRNKIKILSHNVVVKAISLLGTYSLGIYLVHILVVRYFTGYNLLISRDDMFSWFISFLIVTVVSLAVAFVLEKSANHIRMTLTHRHADRRH